MSDELYSKATHFLLEFIQNADDNSYPEEIVPTMRVSLEPGWLIVQCNEIGFTEANVKALCKIGASTKKSQEGYIGGHPYFHTTVPGIDYGLILLQERRVLVSCISCFYGMLKLN